MKALARVWVAALGFLAISAFSSRADFMSFNDFAWSSGQYGNAITKYTPGGVTNGVLLSYPGGVTNSVRVCVSGAAASSTYIENIPAGSDAAVAFGGKVSCSNGIYWSSGELALSFTGLNPGKCYDFVAYSSRGHANASYSNRYTIARITDVTSFENGSSAGSTVTNTVLPNDTTQITAANLSGMVYKYVAIAPGADGDMQVRFKAFANPGYGTNAYLNAFMLVEYGGGPVFFVR